MADALGEFELIAALRARIEDAGGPTASAHLAVGSGDDASVTTARGAAVTSVDALVEGVHFDRRLVSPRSIGHKALAAALSDLAAMGAEPGEGYVQLALPDDFGPKDCLGLADGLAEVAALHGVVIAGGDISRASELMVALTVVGYTASAEAAVLRSGACPGESVVVTGQLGGAAAGLLVLRRDELAGDEDLAAMTDRLVRRQIEPEPRLEAGRALAGAGVTAMIDLSDGLGADAAHLAAASSVGITIELQRLPVEAGVSEVAAAARVDALDLAAAGGEDYELLATLPAERIAAARDAVEGEGLQLTEIGVVRDGAGAELIDDAGVVRPASGFDHLAPRPARTAPG